MKVVIDTSVWSLALRRPAARLVEGERALVARVRRLIDEHRVLMLGPIRQELLSGIRRADQFAKLRDRLRAFRDEPLTREDHETAAAMSNECRSTGLAVSSIDVLLCAVVIRRDAGLLTVDGDFARYADVLPLRLLDV